MQFGGFSIMGFCRSLIRYLAVGSVVVFGFKVADSLGYTPVVEQFFNNAACGFSNLVKDVTKDDVSLYEIVDVDELIATAENVRNQLPEGKGLNVNASIDSLISLVDNLSLNDIPPEYVSQIKEVLFTSTGALEDMNVNLDDITFDNAFNILNESINKLQKIETDMNIVVHEVGTYNNYGTYY